MLKFENVKNDLCYGSLKKAIFGAYDANDRSKKEILSITELEVAEHLKNYEIDFQDIYNDYNEYDNNKIVDLDDFFYDDMEYDNLYINLKDSNNSYNWNCSAVFNYDVLEINDFEYIAIKFHRFGDVRGNYTDYMLLKMSIDEFYEVLNELTCYFDFDFKGSNISVDYNIFNESGVYNIYSEDLNIDIYDTYIDIDNTNEDTTKASIMQFLKENNYI